MSRATISFVVLLAVSLGVSAEPTRQVKGGQSIFQPGESLQEMIDHCQLARVKPASIKPDASRFRLPVSGGVVDTGDYRGEVSHRGGLTLSSCDGGEARLSLQNFRLENLGDVPVVTAFPVLNGDLQDRIPVLLPDPAADFDSLSGDEGDTLRLVNVPVLLAPEAAGLLNATFGSVFSEDPSALDQAGTLTSRLKLWEDDSGDRGPGSGASEAKAKDKDKGKDKDKPESDSDSDDDDGED